MIIDFTDFCSCCCFLSIWTVSQQAFEVWFLHSCFLQTVRTRRPSLCTATRTRWRYCAHLCTSTPSLPFSLTGAGSVKVSKAARARSPRPPSRVTGRSRAHWPIRRSQANRPQWHGSRNWTVSGILVLLSYSLVTAAFSIRSPQVFCSTRLLLSSTITLEQSTLLSPILFPIASFLSAFRTSPFSSGLWMLCLCACSCVTLVCVWGGGGGLTWWKRCWMKCCSVFMWLVGFIVH